jgi:membrane-associated phospholipid phosphatase
MLVLPDRWCVSRFLLLIASLISIATVYGRYHYLADALAGLLVALVAFGALPKAIRPTKLHPGDESTNRVQATWPD